MLPPHQAVAVQQRKTHLYRTAAMMVLVSQPLTPLFSPTTDQLIFSFFPAQPPPSAKSETGQSTTSFPVKTDKPRPHVCTTCSRSFARLEHLKRHERSHTKEKPFECPECTRCFARRDLLLRHQQKLHMTTTPSSRPRGNRRESTNSMTGNTNRVRKNSTSSVGSGMAAGPRPRANTISHIDRATLGILGGANRSMSNLPGADTSFSTGGPSQFPPRGMSASGRVHGNVPALPRLATQGHNIQMGGELRTAPVGNGMGHFPYDPNFQFNSTINPAQLHMNDSMGMLNSPGMNPQSPFIPQPAIMEDEGDMDWMHGFSTQMSFSGPNGQGMPENAIQDSPQPMNGPMGGFGDMSFDPSGANPNMMWPQPNHMSGGPPGSMAFDSANPTTSTFDAMTQTISPGTLHPQVMPETIYENSALDLNINGNMPNLTGHFHSNRAFSSDGTDGSSAAGSAGRQSSVTSTSIDSITDTTRNALLISLSQPSAFGPRKFSQPNVNASLSVPNPNLPSTSDLQRYVSAYISYFHPHMPFIHVPTLSFDQPAFNSNIQSPNGAPTTLFGGGGCLVLAMAAIGALYEFEREASKELFEAAKRMISLYLEERRKAEAHPSNKQSHDPTSPNTPLWLVQAMLLNIVSGHQSDDKIAGNIASTHCTALVSLAKSAGLTQPLSETDAMTNSPPPSANNDVNMGDTPIFHDPFGGSNQALDESSQWYNWINMEERKRTVFAIFHMSSLLVVAYNHAPALMNSEMHLDLPCDEVLWRAETPQAWASRKRELGDSTGSMPFSSALGELLMASQKQSEFRPLSHGQAFGSGIPREEVPISDLKPSTYGCLVLIDALHNYIWETRQRHYGREWTTQETEQMQAHIEPALRAWQAAWNSNPEHSLERPNPHGHGPLSADSIPLLDLAYVRLFVNLGTSKDAIWQRDYQTMSDEIAHGSDFIQHADNSGDNTSNDASTGIRPTETKPVSAIKVEPNQSGDATDGFSEVAHDSSSGKRERYLRRAAAYAADSLIYADKLGVTFGDFSARELPVQSAVCTFDCAQVLAEWVATVQERVGRYVGIIGRDPIDFSTVPAIMLLDEEDTKLFNKCEEILQRAEHKMSNEIGNATQHDTNAAQIIKNMPSSTAEGYGSKILRSTSFILGRSLVWPGE